MSMQSARDLALEWSFWFQCPFFVIELSPGVYTVAARVNGQDKVVDRVLA